MTRVRPFLLLFITLAFSGSYVESQILEAAKNALSPLQMKILQHIDSQRNALSKILGVDPEQKFLDIFPDIKKYNVTQIKNCYDMTFGEDEFNMFENTIYVGIQSYYKQFSDNFEFITFPAKVKSLFDSFNGIAKHTIACLLQPASYKLGLTQLSDFSDNDYKGLLGARPDDFQNLATQYDRRQSGVDNDNDEGNKRPGSGNNLFEQINPFPLPSNRKGKAENATNVDDSQNASTRSGSQNRSDDLNRQNQSVGSVPQDSPYALNAQPRNRNNSENRTNNNRQNSRESSERDDSRESSERSDSRDSSERNDSRESSERNDSRENNGNQNGSSSNRQRGTNDSSNQSNVSSQQNRLGVGSSQSQNRASNQFQTSSRDQSGFVDNSQSLNRNKQVNSGNRESSRPASDLDDREDADRQSTGRTNSGQNQARNENQNNISSQTNRERQSSRTSSDRDDNRDVDGRSASRTNSGQNQARNGNQNNISSETNSERQSGSQTRDKRQAIEVASVCKVKNRSRLPAKFDWRSQGKVTPAKYQGSCGSCWAFSALASLESAYLIKDKTNNRRFDLSEQELLSCARKNGCKGGTAVDAYNYMLKNKGVGEESALPYDFKEKKCNANKRKPKKVAKINDYCLRGIYVKNNGKAENLTDQEIQFIIREFGPVYATINADDLSMKNLKSGVYNNPKCPKQTNHAITIVGWDEQAWIVKNSWGQSWGDKGFFRMKRGQNLCGLNTYIMFPIV